MPKSVKKIDVLIIGAGASGLMCAIEAGKRGRSVLVIDQALKPGQKICLSGGGKCNFTNIQISSDHYISSNPHFCKSALKQFSQWDFIHLLEKHRLLYEERNHGQLFCKESAKNLLDMLLTECRGAHVLFLFNKAVICIEKLTGNQFKIMTTPNEIVCQSLVIATGGLSIPGAGASPFGYKIAEQFNIHVLPVRAGLVPFTLDPTDKKKLAPLSGIAVDAIVKVSKKQFRENILFTHRGLSGPAILQASSYWQPGQKIIINLLPDINLFDTLKNFQKNGSKKAIKSLLSNYLPKRLIHAIIQKNMAERSLQETSLKELLLICDTIHQWTIIPCGTEGYRTAEVTLGGVDVNEISSKTMEALSVKGLFFTGEVLDVTGRLGGYNLQWAWSSGWCAGQNV
ncbi:MAG: NAD(P)/FAD-dependent oxidoreductase [Proteobacteria bacterium]|nr:NAD(P)/FAD-dependent oxidoreductase [Pseudomonadota bacterium]MBU1581822.1 NAD(P)/FAD-dependent oxidoreductase [Pseudomonadota bacterium]MBU2453117.1 NAD(P)/FAD-dependent oxidoreductase [Pseudomonadota bacterium]MBU2629387.1 NAD(P)/FAD-dependent oxidoreductase [Pseudomonadota bacterium]